MKAIIVFLTEYSNIFQLIALIVVWIFWRLSSKRSRIEIEALNHNSNVSKSRYEHLSELYSKTKAELLFLRDGLSIDVKNKKITIDKIDTTPLKIHRLLSDLLDEECYSGDDLLDITDTEATLRLTDERIEVCNHWVIVWNGNKFIKGDYLK